MSSAPAILETATIAPETIAAFHSDGAVLLKGVLRDWGLGRAPDPVLHRSSRINEPFSFD